VEVSIRQLRDFVALAAAGSFTRAASEIHVAQPALSYQIKRLERVLGVVLFEREPRGVSLTAAGAELHEHAVTALRAYDSFLDQAAALRQGTAGQLRVGFLAQGPGELMPQILRAFRERHPHADLRLHQFGPVDCFMGVSAGITDVGFTMGPVDDDAEIAVEPLFEQPVVVAMAADHHLARRHRIRIEEILDEPLFTDTHPPGRWSSYWDALAYRGGREPIIAGRFSSHDEWLEAVRLGGGIGLCPEGTARYYPRPGLLFVALDGFEPIPCGIAWRRGTSNALVADFVATAVRQADLMRSASGEIR
jgi:DNA-binding transcriptional LysR family regulator